MNLRSKKNKPKKKYSQLLQWLSDTDLCLRHGFSPLYIAIMQNDTSRALALIKKGIDIDTQDAQGWTPLFQARLQRNYKVIQALLAANASTALQAKSGDTIYTYPFSDSPLFTAIILDNTHVLSEKLITHGVMPQDLALAIQLSRHACLKILLAAKPNLNAQDFLRQALEKNDFTTFNLLFKAGAVVSKAMGYQNSMLHTMISEKSYPTPAYLAVLKNLYQESALSLAKKKSTTSPILRTKKDEASLFFFHKSLQAPIVVGAVCAGALGIYLWRARLH